MVEEAVARNDMLFSLSTLRRDCDACEKSAAEFCSFETKQYDKFHVHVDELEIAKGREN
jgi:hypothetical protein